MPSLSKRVTITNPASREQHFTSRKKAAHYIATGRARQSGPNSIEFIADDHRHVSALRTAISTRPGYDRAVGAYLAQERELQALPMVGDVMRVYSKGGPSTPANRHSAGRVIMRSGVML